MSTAHAPDGSALKSDYGTEGVLDRLGCPLHFWLKGPDHAPLVTFIHGAGLDHRTWAPSVDAFADEYRVLTLDVRGHGASRPVGDHYTLPTIVDDCLAVLDDVGASSAILIGLSMGGNIAQEILFHYPKRVDAIICLGSACQTLKLTPGEKILLPVISVLMATLRWYPRQKLLQSIGENTSLTAEGQRYVIEAEGVLTKKEIVKTMTFLLNGFHYEPNYRVEVPELIMRGSSDKLGNFRKAMPKWHARDRNSEFVIIPDAGHVANMDNPEFFNRTVLDWLRRRTDSQT